MALSIRGKDILSVGEFSALCRQLDPLESSPTLTAWAYGEDVSPVALWAALQVDARLAAGDNERAHAMIDLTVNRLTDAFPELGFT